MEASDKNGAMECGKTNASRPGGSDSSSDSSRFDAAADRIPRPALVDPCLELELELERSCRTIQAPSHAQCRVLPTSAMESDESSASSSSSSPATSGSVSAMDVAVLARCLCVPLVSIRVGKIVCHGHFLRPTASRGRLDLAMLPTSELRLSFLSDEGVLEVLAVVRPPSSGEHSFAVELQEISTDASGRSFVLKLAPDRSVFFWQSEKSKDSGEELVRKMKDILRQRPTLCQLTGMPESHLESIGSYLQTLTPEVTPGSVAPPCMSSGSLVCSSEGNDAPIAVCSQTLAIGMSFALTGQGLASTASVCANTPGGGSSSIAATLFSLDGSQRLLRSSGEVDKKAFAQRILGSLPQTFVPFPLLVSGSVTSPPVPFSAATSFVTAPYYCPCPLGGASALQCSTLALPHLPLSMPSPPTIASVGPPPPILPPFSFSLSSSVSLMGKELVSGPLIGVVLPCPLRPDYADGFDLREASNFSGSVELTSLYSTSSLMEIVPGVMSSNGLSRVITDRVSTSPAGFANSPQLSSSVASSRSLAEVSTITTDASSKLSRESPLLSARPQISRDDTDKRAD